MMTQDELDVFVNELIDEQFQPVGVNTDGET
jgi:hypothetical protein